jgi:hypothetical protein
MMVMEVVSLHPSNSSRGHQCQKVCDVLAISVKQEAQFDGYFVKGEAGSH